MQSNKSILLIDDDEINNLISTKIIARHSDYAIISFTSATEALKHLQDQFKPHGSIPEFIFLDINMPVMDGWEFLEEFRKFPSDFLDHCSVIMLTSSIDIHDIEKSKRYACVRDFISKPLTPESLNLLSKFVDKQIRVPK